MRLSGFSFVRNGSLYDYPFVESIQSILPICDEFVLAVGKSEDDTLERIKALREPKIRILETVWDESLREGGVVLAQQTNLALDRVKGDWAFYLQADEVVHEHDLANITDALQTHDSDASTEGFLFDFKHFYGSFAYVGNSRRWYRHEIRIIRNGMGVRSWGDAQGFRVNGRKLRVRKVGASIFHYGWVKSPTRQQGKQKSFNRYWHDDQWILNHVGVSDEYDYTTGGRLVSFDSVHPSVMARRINGQQWNFHYDPEKVQRPLKERVLDWFEDKTGLRIGEYKNYKLL